MITTEELEDIFAKGGKLEESIANFEVRDSQLEMACDVARVFNEETLGAIEAGTGTGKSFAYLAVALLNAVENQEDRTVIATSNVALQLQLVNKDLPILEKAMGLDVPYCLLLGKNRYICVYKLLNSQGQLGEKDEASVEERIYSWYRKTRTGLVDELDQDLLKSSFLNRHRCDKDECRKGRCPSFNQCFYYNALALARKSKIVVTNHALLFIDSSIREENGEGYEEAVILPSYNRLIIDECHNIDKSATEYYSSSLTKSEVMELESRLISIRYKSEGRTLVDILFSWLKSITNPEIEELRSVIQAFTTEAYDLLDQLLCAEDVTDGKTERLVVETIKHYDENIKTIARQVRDSCERVCNLLDFYLSQIKEEDLIEEDIIYYNMLTSCLHSYAGLGSVLSLYDEYESHDELIFYYRFEKEKLARGKSCQMWISPLCAGKRLRASIFSQMDSLVFTSATIKTGNDYNYFLRQVGLEDRQDIVTGFYPSPFDYANNAMLIFPTKESSVRFNHADREAYADYLARLIVPSVANSEGGALVLFHSRDMLERVYDRIKNQIKQKLLVQKRGTSTDFLRREFLDEKDSVLLGLKTFWEGIDVPGDALRLLIITQLPYNHVDDCILKARKNELAKKGEGENAGYWQIDYPMMLIELKQGLGRLIRSKSDRGVAIIADNRVSLPQDMQRICACIPPCYVPEEGAVPLEDIARKVGEFLYP